MFDYNESKYTEWLISCQLQRIFKSSINSKYESRHIFNKNNHRIVSIIYIKPLVWSNHMILIFINKWADWGSLREGTKFPRACLQPRLVKGYKGVLGYFVPSYEKPLIAEVRMSEPYFIQDLLSVTTLLFQPFHCLKSHPEILSFKT